MIKFSLNIEANSLTELQEKIAEAAKGLNYVKAVEAPVTKAYIDEPVDAVKNANLVEASPVAEEEVSEEVTLDNAGTSAPAKRRRRTKAEIEADAAKVKPVASSQEPAPVYVPPTPQIPMVPTTDVPVQMPPLPSFATPPPPMPAPVLLDTKSFEYFKQNYIEKMAELIQNGQITEEWVIKHKPMFNNKELDQWPTEEKALEGLHGFLLHNNLI